MCLATNEHPNRTQVCTVGDLAAGSTYRTPDGETVMVTDQRMNDLQMDVLGVTVVSLSTGRLNTVGGWVRLGQDRRGRLYASRYLNDPKGPPAEEVVDLSVPPQPPSN